jgi:hypothetical protein
MPDWSTRLTAANSSAPIVRPPASAMLGNDTHPPRATVIPGLTVILCCEQCNPDRRQR